MRPSRLQIVFWLDAVLFLSACALEIVPFTGLILHEWLGLGFAAGAVAHLLLSWNWVASATRKLMASGSGRTRVNYSLNLALFASVTATLLSGILISQEAIPALTRKTAAETASFAWESIHDRLSDIVVILAGLHVAINWNWIAGAARRMWNGREESAS